MNSASLRFYTFLKHNLPNLRHISVQLHSRQDIIKLTLVNIARISVHCFRERETERQIESKFIGFHLS